MKTKINILWTGGLDSTFRILELSKQRITIQPYYLSSVNPSTEHELSAIADLTEIIKKRPETQCELLPCIVVDSSQITPDESITKAWENLHQKTHLGSQYEFIARFAAQKNLILELGIEKDPHESTIQRCLDANGGGRIMDGYVVANIEQEDMALIFSNMRFPLPLFEMTKQDEIKMFKKWNAEDVLNRIRFCYRPINGKPCGLCDPCKTYIEVGLSSMIPTHRLFLYKLKKNNAVLFHLLKRIQQSIRKIVKK